ncbi:MAG: hypothetical protein AAGE52_42195 [Myxococcota bacterium]
MPHLAPNWTCSGRTRPPIGSSPEEADVRPGIGRQNAGPLLGCALLVALGCSEAGASDPAPVERTEAEAPSPQRSIPTPPTEPEEPVAEQESPYQCTVPAIPIPRPRECVRGRSYPRCKWQMPHATLSDGRYRRWRNTIVEHWWGRPALVSWILASTDDYERIFPDQVVAVGDLDAPGPRHRTHDRGVDVDLYLLGAMRVENAGGGRYPKNYEGKSDEEVEALRERVETLARILATCSQGQLRIYYNDEVVIERFLAWYAEQNFPASDEFEAPMVAHNDLHEFHFHVTIPEDLPVLPRADLPEGQGDPIAPIEAPPAPGSAPHLSSMNRRPGDWAAVPRE